MLVPNQPHDAAGSFVGRFVTLNISKGSLSASVGIPGFRITSGTSGSRVTIGIPGTGLFYTEPLTAFARQQQAQPRVRQLAAAYLACASGTVTADDILAALDRQRTLGLTDAELPREVLDAKAALLEVLQRRFGYRVVTRAAAPRRSPSLVLPLAIIAGLLIAAAVATWWLR